MLPKDYLALPFTLPNGTVIKNRIVKSAMSETLGTAQGRIQPGRLERLYSRWAAGGLGLSITGNVMIDRRALGEPHNVVVEDESDLTALKRWAEAGTQFGGQIWMQINHPGKQGPQGLNRETVAPSAVPLRGDGVGTGPFFGVPRELTGAEIEELIQRFGRTAAIAKKAGFSGVQLHGAHGYLISQFLSPFHNRRGDEWGGSAEKRRRFVLAVLEEVRRQVGAGFPVGIKLNSADFQRGGFTEDESLETIHALAQAGIDLVEISGGCYEAPVMMGARKSTLEREAYFLEFTEKVRSQVRRVPLMLTGGFRTLNGMGGAVSSGAVDFVGLARPLAIEPELPRRLLNGQEARFPVRSISTGFRAIDRMGFLEITWYTRQLQRMGKGKMPRPGESALWSLGMGMIERGWGAVETRLQTPLGES